MATLPPIKRFILEDYGGVTKIPDFCSKFFYPLNLFLNAVYSALQNGLTINANSIGVVSTQASIKASSAGVATTTINWPYSQSPPVGCAVLACVTGTAPVTAPLVSWSYNAGVVSISMQFIAISSGALVVGGAGTYSVTFWISGG